MNILLDTCTFIWAVSESSRLSIAARTAIQDPTHQVFLSAVSSWEILLKHGKGLIELSEPPPIYIPKYRVMHNISSLALEESDTFHIQKLPWHHRDPFDRLLISQAISHQMAIVTPDAHIQQYPIHVIW